MIPPAIDHTFATPIYHGMVSNYESIQYQIDKRIDNGDIKFDNKQFPGSPHWLSEGGFSGDVIKESGFNCLSKEIYRHVDNYCDMIDVSKVIKRYKRNRTSWIALFKKGDYAQIHNHGDTDISGVYYYKSGEDKNATIHFESPNPYLSISKLYKANMNGTFYDSGGNLVYPSTSGIILLFPGWLMHGVHRNTGDEDRMSISFNISLTSSK